MSLLVKYYVKDRFRQRINTQDKRAQDIIIAPKGIFEFTFRELKREGEDDIDFKSGDIEQRSAPLSSFYDGVNSEGDALFRTTSDTTSGVQFWNQRIKFLDLDEAVEIIQDNEEDFTDRDIIDLVVFGEIAVYCDCPAFLYWGYKYMAWSMEYGIKREVRPPDIRNPAREGSVCKHLYNVFHVLPFHINQIVGDMRREGIL